MKIQTLNRREFVAAGLALGVSPTFAAANSGMRKNQAMLKRAIPSSGESLPVIGLGTYNVFDVESTPAEIATRRKIVELLANSGGSLLDTSPMYNRSEKVIGDVINAGVDRERLFLATKSGPTDRNPGRNKCGVPPN